MTSSGPATSSGARIGDGFQTKGTFDPDVEPPRTAQDTGFVRQGNRILLARPATVYITRPDGRTERWPEMKLGCA